MTKVKTHEVTKDFDFPYLAKVKEAGAIK